MRVSETTSLWPSARLERAIYVVDDESDEEPESRVAQRPCVLRVQSHGGLHQCGSRLVGVGTNAYSRAPIPLLRGAEARRQ